MMNKLTAYISISYQGRKKLEEPLQAIRAALTDSGVEAWVFVDRYRFEPGQELAMMQQAMRDIDACDFLVAETSDKAIGIGVEAGYAKGRGKPVIYIRQREAEHSGTMSGISDYQLHYASPGDLQRQLTEMISRIKERLSRA